MKIKHFHLKEVSSTNDIAKDLLPDNDIVVVTADYQTQGRGRNERTWIGNSGEHVYCSIGINHQSQISYQQVMLYQVMGAMISAKALREITENRHQFRLKYPNDVMVQNSEGKFCKISGVLAEHSFQGEFCVDTIIGIGININQTQFENVTMNTPSSLKLLGENCETEAVIHKMIEIFQKLYSMDLDQLFIEWQQELNFINKTAIIVGKPGEWKITQLFPDGRVELEDLQSNKKTIIDNGDSIRYALD